MTKDDDDDDDYEREREREPKRDLSDSDGAPAALVAWAMEAYSDEIIISKVRYEDDYQGETALPGDWRVEFDGQMGILFRPVGSKRLCVVTRNDGMDAEIIEV